MLKHHHEAYREILAAVGDTELAPLHDRTAAVYPILARLIAAEMARRGDARWTQIASSDACPPEFAAAA